MTYAASAVDVAVERDHKFLLVPTSFTLRVGGSLALLGKNGAGKTTLLRLMAGVLPPTTGHLALFGQRPNETRDSFRSRVAVLIGLPPLARNLTLREHLVLVGITWSNGRDDALVQANSLLDELQISSLAQRFPHELSSGQTQLFALALTLARPFEMLLLDEPEQRLDVDRLELLADVLRRRAASGKTLVLASHNLELVERVTDQTLTIVSGDHDPRG